MTMQGVGDEISILDDNILCNVFAVELDNTYSKTAGSSVIF